MANGGASRVVVQITGAAATGAAGQTSRPAARPDSAAAERGETFKLERFVLAGQRRGSGVEPMLGGRLRMHFNLGR